jgi:ATP-dependent Lon protease
MIKKSLNKVECLFLFKSIFSLYFNHSLLLKSIDTYHPDIIIVKKNEETKSVEPNKLQYVPVFYPIIKSSIDMKDDKVFIHMNPESMIKLSEIIRNHLNICAYNVTQDEEAITIEIKQVHFVIDMMLQNFSEKQRKYAKFCEQFKSIGEISNSLKRIQRTMDEVLPMIDEINDHLPSELKLEKFSF